MNPNPSHQIKNTLSQLKIFSKASPIDIARLVPYITEKQFPPNTKIFQTGSKADYFYIVKTGSIHLISQDKLIHYYNTQSRKKESLVGRPVYATIHSGQQFGQEAALTNHVYHCDAITSSQTTLLIIPKTHFQQFIQLNPKSHKELEISLLNHYSQYQSHESIQHNIQPPPPSMTSKIVGWIFAIIIPILVFSSDSLFDLSMEWKTKYFLTILSATITMWIFQLANEFIPTIFAILSILTLNLAPPSVALSGFTAGSFFMAMSIFGIATIFQASGLAYRIVLNILKSVPSSQFWHSITVFLTGVLITPIFPSTNGRIALASPILSDIVDSLNYKYQGKSATQLSISTFAGFTIFSAVFLSSKSINFAVYSLFPFQVREQFDWLYWAFACLPATLLLIVSFLILNFFFFKRNSEIPKLSKHQIQSQISILGPPSSKEWATLISIFFFLIGIMTSSFHKIQLPWIGFIVLYFILSLNFLRKKNFQKNIDWPFLIYLASLIGLAKSMVFIGLNDQIISFFKTYPFNLISSYMISNFYLFVLLFSSIITLFRFFIPNNATVIILCTIFIPIAYAQGLNPWIIGFIVIFISDNWFFSYQSTYYILFKNYFSKKQIYSSPSFVSFFIIINFLKIFIIFLSIPYWKFIGIL